MPSTFADAFPEHKNHCMYVISLGDDDYDNTNEGGVSLFDTGTRLAMGVSEA